MARLADLGQDSVIGEKARSDVVLDFAGDPHILFAIAIDAEDLPVVAQHPLIRDPVAVR